MSTDSGPGSLQLKTVHKYLDAKPQFLWWEMDDLMILCGPIILGIIVGKVFYALIFSLIVGKIYGTMKSTHQEGFMRHFLYHHGMLKFKNCPDSWMKEFTE